MFELTLKNGRSIATTNAQEVAAFFESNGRTIDGRKSPGGKSKGARNKGKKVVRPRDAS